MMRQAGPLQRDTPFYLIPIMLGMTGVLFSLQLEDPWLKGTVVLLSLAIPLFVAGNLLARFHGDELQRILLMAGIATLVVGAAVTVSGHTESLVDSEMVSEQVGLVSRWLGLSGLFLGLGVIVFSVSRSQALISELSDRFRHVADNMCEGFLFYDNNEKIVLVNPSLVEMLGVPEEELLGHTVSELAETWGDETMQRQLKDRVRGVASEYQMTWTTTGEERHLWVSGTPIYDRRGRRVGSVATIRDMTEQHQLSKRLEGYTQGLQQLVEAQTRKLADSEKRLRELLLHMNEGFLTVDGDFKVSFANERIQQVLGPGKAIEGGDVFDLVDGDGRGRLRAALNSAGSGAVGRADHEYTFLRADGTCVPVKVSVAPVQNGSEDNSRFSLVVTDLQELKEMQSQMELRARQLEEANRRLRELDRAKDVFLANVSHELRTPLSTLHGYLDIWESGGLGELEDSQTVALNVMGRSADRLSTLIEEMIEFSRMEISGVRLEQTLFSPERLMSECVSSALPHAMKEGVALCAPMVNDVGFMWGDRGKLGQVLGILLSNAVKFSPKGSEVEVRIAETDDGGLRFAVADQGIGIDSAYEERVFNKFYQVDGSMTRRYEGTGMGLSIAKRFAEAHGGRIELESEVDVGSTFSVVIPASLFNTGPSKADMKSLRGMKVSISSEQAEFRSAVAATLGEYGCGIQQFANAYDCARSARETQPDLILVDETQQGLSGWDTAALLREDITTTSVPVVLLKSGVDDGEIGEKPIVDGVLVLPKPFTAAQLAEQVCSAWNAQEGGVALAPHSAIPPRETASS